MGFVGVRHRMLWVVLAAVAIAVVVGSYRALVGRDPEGTGPPASSGAILPPGGPAGAVRPVAQPSARGPSEALPVVGNPAPDFTLQDLDGRRVSLSQFRGRPVILNFWATWCPPCREEMPRIQAFHERYGDRVAVVGVAVGEGRDRVAPYVAERGYTWTFVLDEDSAVAERYLVFGIPVTFALDGQGIIRGKFTGAMSDERLMELAQAAGLGEVRRP